MKSYSTLTKLLLGAALGYGIAHAVSHPRGKIRKYVPEIKVGKVQITPNVKIHTKSRKAHIHHWAYLPPLYLSLLLTIGRLKNKHLVHGIVLGTVLQGLTFSDRFTFIEKTLEEAVETLEETASNASAVADEIAATLTDQTKEPTKPVIS